MIPAVQWGSGPRLIAHDPPCRARVSSPTTLPAGPASHRPRPSLQGPRLIAHDPPCRARVSSPTTLPAVPASHRPRPSLQGPRLIAHDPPCSARVSSPSRAVRPGARPTATGPFEHGTQAAPEPDLTGALQL
ncbi:unnamed protein product [Arctogadus glacialis]